MSRNGFSLIELLVVIAVIAMLSSVALPVFRQGRGQGREIVCASNIRQIGLSVAIYTEEAKTFPHGFGGLQGYGTNPPTGMTGDASYDWQSWWWFDFLSDSLGSDASRGRTLWCPSRRIMRGADTDHVLCGNYGINTSICRIASLTSETEFTGKPLKSTSLSFPSNNILTVDSGYSLISWKAIAPDPLAYRFEAPSRQNTYYLPGCGENGKRDIHPDHIEDALNGRHTWNRINIGYADGHVEKDKPNRLLPDFDEQGRPANYSMWSPVRSR
jgi:prepilin-type N-terminal cleavage/methylation domain-containing protein/prepilin-type processing-associated H-X9-DG protein